MAILRTNRDVRLITGAVGLSAAGDFVLWTVVALHITATTHSAVAVSAFFFCLFAPIVALGGHAGALVDRMENRTLLIRISLVQAAIVAAMALTTGSLAATLVFTLLVGASAAVGSAAEFALVPAAAGEDDVAATNGVVEAARSLGLTAGPLVGGALAAAGLVQAGLLLDAASFLVVAAAALALHSRRVPAGASAETPPRARDGLLFLIRDRSIGVPLAVSVFSLVFFSMSIAAETFFATDVLHAGPDGFGLLISTWTIGMVFGSVAVAKRVPKSLLAAGALLAIVGQGAGILSAALAATLLIALLGFVAGGVAHGVKNVLFRTLLHEQVPEDLRGRAFAAYNAARNGAELGALAAGGVLVGLLGPQVALALSGAVPVVIGIAGLLYHHQGRRQGASITSERTAYAHLQG